MLNLYEILGVDKNATKDQMKKAYRKKAMTMHPDHGGSEEKFHALAVAYDILYDDDKKRRYDSGETADHINSARKSRDAACYECLFQVFSMVIENFDPARGHLVSSMKSSINVGIGNAKNEISGFDRQIKKFTDVLSRVKGPDGPENFFIQACNLKISEISSKKENVEMMKVAGEDALLKLEQYTYESDKIDMNFGVMGNMKYNIPGIGEIEWHPGG